MHQYGIYTVKGDILYDTSGYFSRYDISNSPSALHFHIKCDEFKYTVCNHSMKMY